MTNTEKSYHGKKIKPADVNVDTSFHYGVENIEEDPKFKIFLNMWGCQNTNTLLQSDTY